MILKNLFNDNSSTPVNKVYNIEFHLIVQKDIHYL